MSACARRSRRSPLRCLTRCILSIPAVRQQQVLLEEVAGDDWWQDVTLPMLETMRKRLRALVKLVPRIKRGVVYTDFEDELGDLSLPETQGPAAWRRTGHVSRPRCGPTCAAMRTSQWCGRSGATQQLTAADLDELAALFIESGFGTAEDVEQVTAEHEGFGLFLRAMTGLDYEAAADAVRSVQVGQTLTPQQEAYLELLIEVLAKNGIGQDRRAVRVTVHAAGAAGSRAICSRMTEIDAIKAVLQDIRGRAQPTWTPPQA